MLRALVVVRFPLLLLCLGACRSIVGIEDAELRASGGAPGGGSGSGGAVSGGVGGRNNAAGGLAGALSICEQYCDTVMANCPGSLAVYESKIVCLDVCRQLPSGVRGDKTGNSVECRLFHAAQVAIVGEAEAECPAAGPGGAGVCGQNCDGYCAVLSRVCASEFDAGCNTECKALPDLGTYNSSFTKGDTIQCRLYHVSAATQDSAFHCPHAGGAPPCTL